MTNEEFSAIVNKIRDVRDGAERFALSDEDTADLIAYLKVGDYFDGWREALAHVVLDPFTDPSDEDRTTMSDIVRGLDDVELALWALGDRGRVELPGLEEEVDCAGLSLAASYGAFWPLFLVARGEVDASRPDLIDFDPDIALTLLKWQGIIEEAEARVEKLAALRDAILPNHNFDKLADELVRIADEAAARRHPEIDDPRLQRLWQWSLVQAANGDGQDQTCFERVAKQIEVEAGLDPEVIEAYQRRALVVDAIWTKAHPEVEPW